MIILLIIILTSCSQGDSPEILTELKNAKSLYIKGETDTALSLLERIEEEKPDFIPALYLSGKIYILKNNPDKADEKWRKIIKESPCHIQAGKQLIKLCTNQKRYEEAEAILIRLFEFSADDPELLILAGKLRKSEGRFLEAIEYYSKSFLFEDRIMDAHIDIAEIYGRYGLSDKSELHLEKAAAIGGGEHELYEPVMSVLEKKK